MINGKKIFWLLIVNSAIAVFLRTVLIMSNINREGLYVNTSLKTILLLKIIIIVSSLLFFIFPFFDKAPNDNRSRNKDKILGAATVFLGGAMMFIGLVDFFNILQLIWSTNFSEICYLMSTTPNALMKVTLSVVTFITGWMLTTMSIKIFNKVSVCNNYILTIMLILCYIFRAALFVRENNTIVAVPDNLYSILSIIFSISFCFGLSKLLFDCDYQSGYKIAISSGCEVAFFGLLSTVPNYIAFFVNKNIFFSIKDVNGISNIVTSIFVILFLHIIIFSEGEDSSMFERQESSHK